MAIGYQSASVSVVHSSSCFRRRGSPLDALIISYFKGFVKGFFTFFLRGNTRLLLRLSLRDTHLAMALPGLSP